MKWDLEERTEDAVVSYLKDVTDGSIRISAAWDRKEPEFPCAIVHAGESEPVSEEAAWHDARMIAVEVAVMTEGVDELDDSGEILRTAREINAAARSEIINALAVSNLNAQLVAQGVADIAFSMAQLANCTRSVEEERYLVSTLTVGVLAEPVTGS